MLGADRPTLQAGLVVDHVVDNDGNPLGLGRIGDAGDKGTDVNVAVPNVAVIVPL